ncbi:MAG: proline--tRNA ligase, partial [Chloroflexi bacterium]|nr:proline--tRNA ligase [Chloroflexota bacterium]
MRLSHLFFKTLRETPADADTVSHELLVRSGMIAQLIAGGYSYMPLAQRSISKIENIIRSEMNKCGGQEITMPVLQPVEIWQKSGRDKAFGKNLLTLIDRKERRLVLGPTHEEVVTDLASRFVQSYRDLPFALYQIQTKFRDEARPRAGLIRVREFTMKDMYSFHASQESLDQTYEQVKQAYMNIYQRCGLKAIMIDADSGAIGGKASHEFMLVADSGEDSVLQCTSCNYAANSEKATFAKTKNADKILLPMQEIATPKQKTIEEIASFLKIPADKILKTVLYIADGQLVMALVRGDYEINEIKLKNTLKAVDLRPASDEELRAKGLSAGYIGPSGLKNIRIVADDSVQNNVNLVSGANKEGFHLLNTNIGRDYQTEIVTDIALAQQGYMCPHCDGIFSLVKGIEVGHIFKLGTYISDALNATFTDEEGLNRPIIMGC